MEVFKVIVIILLVLILLCVLYITFACYELNASDESLLAGGGNNGYARIIQPRVGTKLSKNKVKSAPPRKFLNIFRHANNYVDQAVAARSYSSVPIKTVNGQFILPSQDKNINTTHPQLTTIDEDDVF